MRRSPAGFGLLAVLAAVEFAHPAHAEDAAAVRPALPKPVVTVVPAREVVVRVPPRPQPRAIPAATPTVMPAVTPTVIPAVTPTVTPTVTSKSVALAAPARAPERAAGAERFGVAKRLGVEGPAGLSTAAFEAALRATPSWRSMVEVGPAPTVETGGCEDRVLKFPLSSCSSVVFGWGTSDVLLPPVIADQSANGGFGGPYAGIWLHL